MNSELKFSCLLPWCERGDSNPHTFRYQILSLARLPIPPLSQINQKASITQRGQRVRSPTAKRVSPNSKQLDWLALPGSSRSNRLDNSPPAAPTPTDYFACRRPQLLREMLSIQSARS